MACVKAVIVTDISGMWDRNLMIDGQTVFLTPARNASVLARHVRNLADDPGLAEQIGAAGRKVIEEHLNSDAMAHALEKLIEDFND
jgi:glycosyltransferase involved in cell wall biosynthesis